MYCYVVWKCVFWLYLFATLPHPHGHLQLQELLENLLWFRQIRLYDPSTPQLFNSIVETKSLTLAFLDAGGQWSCFQNLINCFFGYLDPINIYFDNKNNYFLGWPKRYFGWNGDTAGGVTFLLRSISSTSTSASFLAEISHTSPWQFFIFIIYKNIFWIEVSEKQFIPILKTVALTSTIITRSHARRFGITDAVLDDESVRSPRKLIIFITR